MRLRRLFLKNFATYHRVELRYDLLRYPVFVSGDTGAGKTSILVDALSAALFGRAYGEKREGSLRYATRGGEMEIELEFEIGGKVYSISRSFSKTSGHRAVLTEISKDGRIVLARSVKEVEKVVREIIGLDMDDFLHTVVVRQGEVASLISESLPPKERTALFQRVFKIDFTRHLERAKESRRKREFKEQKLEEETSRLRKEVKEKEKIKQELMALESNILEVSRKIEHLEAEKTLLESKKLETERRLSGLRELLELAKLTEEVNRKRREAEHIRHRLAGLINKLESFLSLLEAEERKLRNQVREESEVRRRIDECNRALIEINRRISELKAEINRLRKWLHGVDGLERSVKEGVKPPLVDELGLNDRWEGYRGRLESLKKKLEDARRRALIIDAEIRSHERAIEELRRGRGRCPVCLRPIVDLRAHIVRHNEEISGLKLQAEKVRTEEGAAQDEITEASRGMLSLIRAKLSEELRAREEVCDELMEREKLLRRELSSLRNKLNELLDSKTKIMELSTRRNLCIKAIQEARSLGLKAAEADVESGEKRTDDMIFLSQNASRLMGEFVKLTDDIRRGEEEIRDMEERLHFPSSPGIAVVEIESRIKAEEKQLSEVGSRIRAVDEALKQLMVEKREKEVLRDERQKVLMEILEKERRLERMEEELKSVKEEKEILKIVEKRIFDPKGFPVYLLKEYLASINEYANEYLNRFINGLTIDIRVDSKTSNVTVDVYDELLGSKRELFTYSGGERTIIGFAIRLAISKVLAEEMSERPRFLIIDEGFGSISEELRESLVKLISELCEDYDQIIVTSHIQDIRDSGVFQQELKVVKEGGISRIIA